MSAPLATRCPACSTVFRVVPDQLRVSEGWVRCGRCSEVFDATEHLLDLDTGAPRRWIDESRPRQTAPKSRADKAGDAGAAPGAPTASSARRASADTDAAPRPKVMADLASPGLAPLAPPDEERAPTGFVPGGIADAPARQLQTEAPSVPAIVAGDARAPGETADVATHLATHSATRLATPSATHMAAHDAAGPAAVTTFATKAEVAPEPRTEPHNDLPADLRADLRTDRRGDRADVPSFVRRAERAQRWRRPRVRAALATLAGLAILGLAAQVGYEYRDLVAARFPQAKPALVQACTLLGCRVEAAHAIDALAVESSGLLRVEKSSIYRLAVALRNRAAFEVALPAVDLSLTDTQARLIARKVLFATDLGATQSTLGAGRELTLQATLQAALPADESVAGYTIELFHP